MCFWIHYGFLGGRAKVAAFLNESNPKKSKLLGVDQTIASDETDTTSAIDRQKSRFVGLSIGKPYRHWSLPARRNSEIDRSVLSAGLLGCGLVHSQCFKMSMDFLAPYRARHSTSLLWYNVMYSQQCRAADNGVDPPVPQKVEKSLFLKIRLGFEMKNVV